MNPIDEHIKSGSYAPVYLLYGEERYLLKQYRDKLCGALTKGAALGDDMNFTVFEGKEINPKTVIDLAETLPFFASHRVIVIRESGFFKNACEELADYVPQLPETTRMIFVETEVDKRGRLYKAVKKKGEVVEFATQTQEVITRWILSRLKKEGKNITAPVMRMFLDKTGMDMGTIDRELEKLICYAWERDVIDPADVEAVVTEQIANKIFDMMNAVVEHNQKKALDLYYDLLTLRESPMRILYLMNKQFVRLLHLRDMAARGMDARSMAQKAEIPEFAVRRNLSQAKGFTMEQLRGALSDGAELEEAVKTGRLNDKMAVELFLVKYSAASGDIGTGNQ